MGEMWDTLDWTLIMTILEYVHWVVSALGQAAHTRLQPGRSLLILLVNELGAVGDDARGKCNGAHARVTVDELRDRALDGPPRGDVVDA